MNVIELKNVNYKSKDKNKPFSINIGGESRLDRENKTFSLEDINFTVKPGELLHLDGEIGAGKSTLIDFILGVREPDSGEIKVFGSPPGKIESRFLTGVTPQKLRSPIQNVRLGSLIDFIESHYPQAEGKVKSILEDFEYNLSGFEIDQSGGQERIFFIALALSSSPKLLILDEPTTFLDKRKKEILRNQLKNFVAQGNTALLICHDSDVQEFFQPTRTLLLKDGRISETIEDKETFSTTDQSMLIDSTKEVGISHWIYLLFTHIKFNIEQTFQNDGQYILLRFITSVLWAVIISIAANTAKSQDSSSLLTIANAYSFYLALTATGTTGNIIVEERQNEILTKLLKILPLPPIIYLSAKVIASLFINSLLVLMMLVTTIMFHVFPLAILPSLSIGLILGTIPYLFLGLALGYLVDKPKNIQIAAFMCSTILTIPLFVRNIVDLVIRPLLANSDQNWIVPNQLDLAAIVGDNIAAHSPIYHYIQLILYLGKAPEYDQYIGLHLGWLIWFTLISLFIALWTYWGISKKEAKA